MIHMIGCCFKLCKSFFSNHGKLPPSWRPYLSISSHKDWWQRLPSNSQPGIMKKQLPISRRIYKSCWSLTLVPSHGCLTILRYLQDKDGLAALHLKGKWWREPLKFHQPYRSEPGQWDIKHRNHSNHCSTSSCSKLHIQVVSDRFMSLASNFKFIQSWCLYELHPSKYL